MVILDDLNLLAPVCLMKLRILNLNDLWFYNAKEIQGSRDPELSITEA